MLKIGFIGYSGHATRLIKIFDNMSEISYFYHPEDNIDIGQIPVKKRDAIKTTKNLDDLYSCDGIVISSPNYTHFNYLEKLAGNYKGYIFCEKPPVSNLEELEALAKFSDDDKKRIYFDFNMRFSFLNEILKTFPEKYNLGEPIRISVLAGHGLALKESYKSSWRAKKELHPAGVLETLGIHFFDVASFLFGAPSDLSYKTENYSPYGNSADTCHLSCSFKNRCRLNLTCSYCMPFSENIEINYTNGFINLSLGKIKVFGPRETFDKNGFFIRPPLIYEKTVDENDLYIESLRKSCRFFIDIISNNQEVSLKYFEQSILSNRVCLTAENL